jgi:putative ABC transport system permease protein
VARVSPRSAWPIAPVVVIALIAVLGGVLAALRPATRAARLDVLRAIATE